MPSAYGSIKQMTASIRFQRFPCRSAATQNAKLYPAAALFPKPDIWRQMIDPKCFSCRITSLRSSSGQRPALSNINSLICLRRRISQRGFSSPLSDITIWINGTECGTWRCPSDYGARRGRLNPEWWSSGCTQYGKLLILELSETGCLLNGTPVPNLTIHQFHFSANTPITIRIGNKPDAEYPGGFNIFGKKFGDFEQDIVLSITYASES